MGDQEERPSNSTAAKPKAEAFLWLEPEASGPKAKPGVGGQLAVAGLGLGLGLGLAVLYPFVVIPMTRSLPYMHTPVSRLKQGFAGLRALLADNRQRAFVDLGSGDGEAVLEAVRPGGGGFARAMGIELNWGLVAYSRLRAWSRGLGGTARFQHADLWRLDLRPYDAIMMFGVKPLMAPLAAKVKRECRPGTIIMLYRFKLPAEVQGRVGAPEGDASGAATSVERVIEGVRTEGEFSYYAVR